jgi:hypothetical protein
MIGRKMAAVAVGLAAVMMLAGPAGAGEQTCPGETIAGVCYQSAAQIRVEQWTHVRTTPKRISFTVTATNTNTDTNGGAFDAYLLVTYTKGGDLTGVGQTKTKLATFVPDGGSFTATFSVRKFKLTDGLVTARIEDVLCDGANETVSLA